MPPMRRDSPASFAASTNFFQKNVIDCAGVFNSTNVYPGWIVTAIPNFDDFVNEARICAPAALKVLCPETYSANGGVGIYGCQVSPLMDCVPRPAPPQASMFCPLNRNRMAVTGRTES